MFLDYCPEHKEDGIALCANYSDYEVIYVLCSDHTDSKVYQLSVGAVLQRIVPQWKDLELCLDCQFFIVPNDQEIHFCC
jgi:hypothetical protein